MDPIVTHSERPIDEILMDATDIGSVNNGSRIEYVKPYQLYASPPSQIYVPLQPALLRAEKLRLLAPDVFFLPLQAIHISKSLLHAVIALALALSEPIPVTQQDLRDCLTLRELGRRIQNLFQSVNSNEEPLAETLTQWQKEINEIFDDLCSIRYGGKEIQQSQKFLENLRLADWRSYGNHTQFTSSQETKKFNKHGESISSSNARPSNHGQSTSASSSDPQASRPSDNYRGSISNSETKHDLTRGLDVIILSMAKNIEKMMSSFYDLRQAVNSGKELNVSRISSQFRELGNYLEGYWEEILSFLDECDSFASDVQRLSRIFIEYEPVQLVASLRELVETCKRCSVYAQKLIQQHNIFSEHYKALPNFQEISSKGKGKGKSKSNSGEPMNTFASASENLLREVKNVSIFFDGETKSCQEYLVAAEGRSTKLLSGKKFIEFVERWGKYMAPLKQVRFDIQKSSDSLIMPRSVEKSKCVII